jgi:arylsulfatase A-like enzyme
LLTVALAGCGDASAPATTARPNFILIVADDLDAASLDALPRVNALAETGLAFERFYVTTSSCSPSRVSFLRGQYAHNHRVLGNVEPRGGFTRFQDLGLELSTLATWLQDAGYRTIFLGKYMNGYPAGEPTYVPRGWDRWFATLERYYDYVVNEDGDTTFYGSKPNDYSTDVLRRKAKEWIREAVSDSVPFLMQLSPRAIHKPAIPAPRHVGAYEGTPLPRPPSFNEADVSDKPASIRVLPRLSEAEIDEAEVLYRLRLETALAVDEMFGALMNLLEVQGIAQRTYVIFTSDNGFHIGQHRLRDGKGLAYEEDVRVPMYVWGPGVVAGINRRAVANIDIAPTIAELAGAAVPGYVDGRSFVDLLRHPGVPWRDDLLIEGFERDLDVTDPYGDAYAALRTDSLLYVEWDGGEVELYDMTADAYQLRSLHATTEPEDLAELSRRLAELRSCSGAGCR